MRKPEPIAAQNLRLRRKNRELQQRLARGLADELRKMQDDTRDAEVSRKISEINTRTRESNARDREAQRVWQRVRP